MVQRRTKIVATIGPAQAPAGALERLLDSGVDVLRVNLSHATPREQAAQVRRARAYRPDVAVLADLGGPKLRLGDLREEIKVSEGDTVLLGAGGIPLADASLFDRVRRGRRACGGAARSPWPMLRSSTGCGRAIRSTSRMERSPSSPPTCGGTASPAASASAASCDRARGSTCRTIRLRCPR